MGNMTEIMEKKVNVVHPSSIQCNEECRKRMAEERHKRKINRLKREEEARKKPGYVSFLSISSQGDDNDKVIEEAAAEEEKKLDKEEKEKEKAKEDEDGKSVEEKIAKFEKA